jgi:ATP-dependent RNA helicase RhlE
MENVSSFRFLMDNSKEPSPKSKFRFNFFHRRKDKAAPVVDAPVTISEPPVETPITPKADPPQRKRENTIVTPLPVKQAQPNNNNNNRRFGKPRPAGRQIPSGRQVPPKTHNRPARLPSGKQTAPAKAPAKVEPEIVPFVSTIKDFETFNLHPSIMEGIRALGYTAPTPIQEQSIPPALEGRDLIGLAQTGTGKTAAFVLPILHRLMSNPKKGTRVLVVSPTRELAEQTCDVFNNLGKKAGIKALAVYGGTSMIMQSDVLRSNPAVVVGCPGRLLDQLWKGSMSLSQLETLVIDEADRMFDMGFIADIRSILKCITGKHQTLLFSATMPDDIRRLVKEFLTDPVTIQIGRTLPAETVSHHLYPVSQHLKSALLREILKKIDAESVLIFTRTKRRAENLADILSRDGHRVSSLQGDLTQSQRQASIDAFRNGKIKILVATDIASRGIDILRISHVINYDMPESTEDYIHRIGRTGRVEKSGEALTLVTHEDAGKIRDLEKILKKPIERVTIEGFNYDAPAHDHTTQPRRSHRPRIDQAHGRSEQYHARPRSSGGYRQAGR